MALRVVPLGGAGAGEQLRHLLLVHVGPDRGVGRGAERSSDKQNSVALYQLARHLDRLGRRIAVVIGNEGDLAPVHAALIVDHLERLRGLEIDHELEPSRLFDGEILCVPPGPEVPMAKKAKAKAKASKETKAARTGIQWEYETISASRTPEVAALNEMLNAVGAQGWELVSAIPEDDATYLVFKRLKA